MPEDRPLSSTQPLKDHYQIVVVGSGYGGGIAASRLARAGQEVCLLERGREIRPGDYPNTVTEAGAEFQVNLDGRRTGTDQGLFDFLFDDEVNVLVGCGLGGTSLINANVSIEPLRQVWLESGRWPQPILDDLDTRVKEGFRLAREMLKPQPYPRDGKPLFKLNALEKQAAYLRNQAGRPNAFGRTDINVTFRELPSQTNHVGVWQEPCTLCGDCFSGCNYRSKNTTLMNYLPDARNHGAQIFTGVLVRRLSRQDGKWLVHHRRADGEGNFQEREFTISADFVVLAAGTLGSTEILLRSQQAGLSTSEALGDRFSGNGDVLGFAYNCDEPIRGVGFGDRVPNPKRPVGPTITGVIDLRHTDPWQNGFIIEEGAIPGAVGALLPAAFDLAAPFGQDTDTGFLDEIREGGRVIESNLRGPYHGAVNHTQTFLVMAHEQTWGRLVLEDGKDNVRIKWKDAGKEAIFTTINEALKDATAALGGTYMINPLWSQLFGRELITVHPLGGAIVAESAQDGVVNHKGQVFSGHSGTQVYETLYVADGAVVPTSLGVNPLFTISALAEREMALLAADRGWTIDYSF